MRYSTTRAPLTHIATAVTEMSCSWPERNKNNFGNYTLTSTEWAQNPSQGPYNTRTSTWCFRWDCWPDALDAKSLNCSYSERLRFPVNRLRLGSPLGSKPHLRSAWLRWLPRAGARNTWLRRGAKNDKCFEDFRSKNRLLTVVANKTIVRPVAPERSPLLRWDRTHSSGNRDSKMFVVCEEMKKGEIIWLETKPKRGYCKLNWVPAPLFHYFLFNDPLDWKLTPLGQTQ